MRTVRIFISSPGDVGAEREKAREIFDRLQTEFSGLLEIAPYFWEHEPMRAHTDFQSQIEPPSKFDLFVCILWARLGSRLHPGLHPKPDGGQYASGTEYELLDALEGFRKSKAPEVLIYKRKDDPLIPARPKEVREKVLTQFDALESFFARLTKEDGYFVVGSNGYSGLDQFETKFEEGMRKVLKQFLPQSVAASRTVPKSWTDGSPFRGLRHFDFEHAPIFFGRTRAIDEVLAALKQQALDERSFVLVFGGSGVGKSSLVRAGVLPWLVKPGVIDGVGLWRRAIMRPSEVNEGDLFDALAAALLRAEGLPEISSDGTSAAKLSGMLRENPTGVGMLIKGALSQAAAKVQLVEKLETQPRALFALAVDQLEELFTIERLSAQRDGFLQAIDGLARSGYVWVLATLRSDFYQRCEESVLLMELKKGAGQYHLQPPNEIQLGQMIRLPAAAAGLLFEEDHKTGERLDDLLRDEAVKNPGSVPLLEFTMEELYEQREADEGLLKLDAYHALGGVAGALAKRADEAFRQLPKEAKAAFDFVMRQLTTLGSVEGEPPARRWAPFSEATAKPGAKCLVEAFVDARLFQSGQNQSGQGIVGFAHEAVLSHWPRLRLWTEENRAFLVRRMQLDSQLREWEVNSKQRGYLLSPGPHLKSARQLFKKHRQDLNSPERLFIRRSMRRAHLRSVRGWGTMIAVAALVLLLSFVGIICKTFAVNGERPAAWMPVVLHYIDGGIAERFGNKQRALAAYQAGFTKSSTLKVPTTLRVADVMIFDSILELTISTDAPIPDDKTCRRVIDWARQYVESQAVGEASDFAIICVTETMGRLFKTKGRWADSAKMYDERMTWVRSKLQRQPGDRDTQETLRNTLIQAGKAKVKAKQPDAGRRDLEEALGMLREAAAHSEGKAKAELLEKASDVAVVLGDVAFESGDAGKAVLSYEDALNDDRELFSQHPDDRVAQRQNLRIDLTRLSQAHRKAKNWPAAEATATEAVNLARVNVSISPNNKDVRDELVETLTKAAEIHATQFSDQSALRKSLDCMTELLTVDPHHAGARSFRGYTHALLGEKEEAVKDFRDTLLDKPGSLPVLRLFGWSYVVLGEPSAALQPWDEYRRVTQASGKPPGGDALMVFAAAEWIRGASEQAVAYYRQFATAAPEWQKSESIGEADWPETRKRVVEAIRARAYP